MEYLAVLFDPTNIYYIIGNIFLIPFTAARFPFIAQILIFPEIILQMERLIDETRTHIKKLEKLIINPKNHDEKDSIEQELKISRKNLEYLTSLDESDN